MKDIRPQEVHGTEATYRHRVRGVHQQWILDVRRATSLVHARAGVLVPRSQEDARFAKVSPPHFCVNEIS
jgi:hypothetical protein